MAEPTSAEWKMRPPYWVWVAVSVLGSIGAVLLWGELFVAIGASPNWTIGWIIGVLVMAQSIIIVTLVRIGVIRPNNAVTRRFGD